MVVDVYRTELPLTGQLVVGRSKPCQNNLEASSNGPRTLLVVGRRLSWTNRSSVTTACSQSVSHEHPVSCGHGDGGQDPSRRPSQCVGYL